MVHATLAYVASKASWNVGIATLTTVMSRMDMIAPSTTTPATLSTAASILSLAAGALPAVVITVLLVYGHRRAPVGQAGGWSPRWRLPIKTLNRQDSASNGFRLGGIPAGPAQDLDSFSTGRPGCSPPRA